MILSNALEEQIERVIREQRHAGRIIEQGLAPRSKLLLVGPPGTGKTMTASVLAGELGLALLQVRLDGLITKYMGETAARLRQVFDSTNRMRGVYFFDEFDAIGSQRGLTNDVGEIRRVLDSFLQMIEQEHSYSLVIAATNHFEILDPALFRPFDDVLHYDLPDEAQIAKLLKTRLSRTVVKGTSWSRLAATAAGLSHADISRAADEALKDALINSRSGRVEETKITANLEERRNMPLSDWNPGRHARHLLGEVIDAFGLGVGYRSKPFRFERNARQRPAQKRSEKDVRIVAASLTAGIRELSLGASGDG